MTDAFSAAYDAQRHRSMKDMMSELGIHEEDLQIFCDWFAPVGYPYQLMRIVPALGMDDGYFFETIRPELLSGYLVAGHLAHHQYTIATLRSWEEQGARRANTLVVDLDQHRHLGWAGPSLEDRLKRCLRALGEPELIFRSSASLGLHLYYLLPECEEEPLVERAERLLVAQDLTLVSGQVELIPHGPGSFLRLPCGWGSYLLDPDDLAPITDDKARQLGIVLERLADAASSLEAPEDRWPLPARLRSSPAPPVVSGAPPPRAGKERGTREGFSRYLREGLPGYGTRNQILTTYMYTGFCATSGTLDEAKTRAVAWLLAQQGRSNLVDQSPGQAVAAAERGIEDTWRFLESVFPGGYRWNSRRYPSEEALVQVVAGCSQLSTRKDAVKNAIRFCFHLLYVLSNTPNRKRRRLAANYLKGLPGASSNPNRPTHYVKLVSLLASMGMIERGTHFRPSVSSSVPKHGTKFVKGEKGRLRRHKIDSSAGGVRGIAKSMTGVFDTQVHPPHLQRVFDEALAESEAARFQPLTWLTEGLSPFSSAQAMKVSTN